MKGTPSWLFFLRGGSHRTPLTGLEDLVPDGEACSVRLVIWHKLDEELVSRRDDGGRGDFPTVLPHQLAALVHSVPHLHIVVPEWHRKKERKKMVTTGTLCCSHQNRRTPALCWVNTHHLNIAPAGEDLPDFSGIRILRNKTWVVFFCCFFLDVISEKTNENNKAET